MVSFHYLGDPYLPNQGNNGLLKESDEDPEEDPGEEHEEDLEEEEEEIEEPAKPAVDDGEVESGDDINDDSDAESEVINPPYPVRVSAHRMGLNGPTPPWGIDIWRWSRQQGQRPPFGMAREFYD
ncbi:uncharacterized protein LOC111916829 [Lactuca sativa]|uniref:uncharacterized protein LOC111916829 n=1 Tax=Lactuca sativa TaxID=4236 RepID=UPI000CD9B315|nr:uncharacterized protein LOC111916829 [Lactuca sativa]